MDIYLFCLILGTVGLGVMALGGLGRHGGAAHGHGFHGLAGSHGHGAAQGTGHVHDHPGLGSGLALGGRAATWLLMSPRFLFAGLLGFGLVGVALRSLFGGVVLLTVAIAGGIAVERLLVAPLWRLSMRFASDPAVTLESATFGEATAVSNFDGNGQGIVAVEVDGQVQQILATLAAADRTSGARVHAGQVVRVEEVDTARGRCIVSLL